MSALSKKGAAAFRSLRPDTFCSEQLTESQSALGSVVRSDTLRRSRHPVAPGMYDEDMQNLACNPDLRCIWMDHVQDFMPTPMTTSSVMFYTGLDPATMKSVFVERVPQRKKALKSKMFERGRR